MALILYGSKRSPLLPEVPTIAESGVDGFNFPIWYGVWAPSSTPVEVIEKLSTDIARALATPEPKEWHATHGAEPMNMSRSEFAQFVKKESETAAQIIEASK